ncbi:MAG: carbohydrate ABC transporter permease [Clostridia bacterium]|nr:carbohydrate ABC transporter permease [Clostridia bacterium]
MIRYKKDLILKVMVHGILIITLFALIFPFIWMLFGAFKDANEVIQMPPKIFPSKFNLTNFSEIRSLFPVELFLFNSILVALVSTLLQMIFCAAAGYIFAKVSFKGRELLFTLYLITMMIPQQLIMITLYKVFVGMNLQNTYLGIILPGTYNALGIFLLRQHISTISDSFLEAGFMDGASHFRVFRQIILPLCKPALATLAILAFMGSWNAFLWPLIITSDTRLATLPLGLSKLQSRWTTSWNLLMAGNVVSFIPMLLVYIFAQRYFIKSISLSGVKG